MPEHDKRVALVTGANRGIGYAISRRLGWPLCLDDGPTGGFYKESALIPW